MNSSFTKTVFSLALIALAGKVFGFFRELLLANFFGTTHIIDAYLMSLAIPSVFLALLRAMGIGFTPVFFEVEHDGGDRTRFTNSVLIISVAISLLCIPIAYSFADDLVRFMARGFDHELRLLTVQYFQTTIWLVFFSTPIQVLISFLNCNHLYVYSNATNLLLSSTQCVFIVVAAYYGSELLAFGIVVAYAIQLLVLSVMAFMHGMRYKLAFIEKKYMRQLFVLIIPIFFSNFFTDLSVLVDKYYASYMREGSISSLTYAFTIRSVFFLLITSSFSTIFFPRIASMISSGNIYAVSKFYSRLFNIYWIIFVPITIICIFFSEEIVYVILHRGKFNLESLYMTATPFAWYSASLFFVAVQDLVSKVLFSFRDARTNLMYDIACIFMNIILSSILRYDFGHVGLAMGTSLSIVFMFFFFVKRINSVLPFNRKRIDVRRLFRIGCSFFPLLLCIFLCKKMFPFHGGESLLLVFFRTFAVCAVGLVFSGVFMYRFSSSPVIRFVTRNTKAFMVQHNTLRS